MRKTVEEWMDYITEDYFLHMGKAEFGRRMIDPLSRIAAELLGITVGAAAEGIWRWIKEQERVDG